MEIKSFFCDLCEEGFDSEEEMREHRTKSHLSANEQPNKPPKSK